MPNKVGKYATMDDADLKREANRTLRSVRDMPISDNTLPYWCGAVFRGGNLLYIAALLNGSRRARMWRLFE